MLISKLTDVLQKECEIYQDLLKIAGNKTDILIQGKVDELRTMTEVEQTLVMKVGKLEITRGELTEQIATQMGVEDKDITISEIIKHISGDAKKELKACTQEIVKVIKQLNDISQSNQQLINQSLDYINLSINLISNTHEGNTYSDKGQSTKGEKKNFLDIKL